MLCYHFHFHFIIFFYLLLLQFNNNTTLVEFLPGFDGPLPFHLWTGYIRVGKSEEVQLFYYFVKSESDPRKDLILIWLTGGPGCSFVTGLLYEIGPLAFAQKTFNGSLPILVSTPYSWTKFASIIFLDQPLNTGFSITSKSSKCIDLQACNYVYEFLLKWFNDHAEFISNPFYVFGDSYSGIIISEMKQPTSNESTLSGYTLSNPATFPEEKNYQIPFSHGMGLITDELYESLKENCKGEYQNTSPTSELCMQYLTMFKKLVSGIYDQHILEPLCGLDIPHQQQLFGERRFLGEEFVLLKNDDSICQESHVSPIVTSRKSEVEQLSSGDHDMFVPFQSTQAWIKNLNYSITDDWRSWIVDGQVAGYTRSYSNHMTFATVKGGGHTAPEYKRKESYHMFKRWITQQSL
ncbi:hypothetical protein P3S67_026947 [Capsicum chacoense]